MALAALVIRVGADASGLNKALSQMDKDIQRAGKQLTKVGESLTKALTVPIAAAAAGLAAAGVHVGAFADKLLDLVDQTGLSTQTLQEFRHVATIAGVETDTLANAAIKLTTKLSSGDEQSKELTGALSRLGLSATDVNGRLVSMDTLLPKIISRLQGVSDVTTRNALAADIFGKSWADLAPILGMGAGAITAAQKEARALGLVLSKEDTEAADAFRAKLDTLKESGHGLALKIGVMMLPVMTKLVDILQKDVIPAVQKVVKWFDDLSPTTKMVIGVVAGLVAALGPLLVVVGSIAKILPLLRVAFTALAGPIGATVVAIGLLVAAGVYMVKNWDFVKLQFLLAWTMMKDAAFTAVGKILDVVAGMAMAFKMTGLATTVMGLRASLDQLADESLVKAAAAAATLEIKMEKAATAVSKTTGEVTRLTVAIDRLATLSTLIPKVGLTPGTSGGFGRDFFEQAGLPFHGSDVADASAKFNLVGGELVRKQDKTSGFGFKSGDSLGTKVSQTILAGGGGGPLEQMVQAFASFGPLAAVLPVINGALQALAPVVTALIAPLVEIGRIIAEALAPILQMLTPVIQLVADILSHTLAPILRGIVLAASYVMEAFGSIVKFIGKLVDSLPFVSAKSVINAGQAMIDAARAARKNATATDTATEAVESFASALSNIPRVLNINALRHMVTGGGGGGPAVPVVPVEGGVITTYGDTYVTINVPGAGDPVAVANNVGAVVERTRVRGGTSRLTLAVT